MFGIFKRAAMKADNTRRIEGTVKMVENALEIAYMGHTWSKMNKTLYTTVQKDWENAKFKKMMNAKAMDYEAFEGIMIIDALHMLLEEAKDMIIENEKTYDPNGFTYQYVIESAQRDAHRRIDEVLRQTIDAAETQKKKVG